MSSSSVATLRHPLQARSEASLERLVGAARELLDREGFGELTVARIARRARSSVGVFYSRFAGKQALLEHLAEVYAAEAHAAVRAFGAARDGSAPGGPAQALADPAEGLADEVRAVVDFAVAFHRERAGLIRALLQEARGHPAGPVARRVRGLKALPPTIERRLLLHRAAVSHPEPARAVADGFFLVVAAVRERVLFGEGAAAGGAAGDEGLADLLARAWLALLDPEAGAATPPGRGALYS